MAYTDNKSIRYMMTFVGTHTYSFLHFNSNQGHSYDTNGHYNYTAIMKNKDAEGNITEGKKVGITTIFNKDKFYIIIDSTKGLTIDEVKKLNMFGENLKKNLKGHQQEGRDFDIVFENDNLVEKNGTISIVARKSTAKDLEGECLAERKAKVKTQAEKDAAEHARLTKKIAALEARMKETSAK